MLIIVGFLRQIFSEGERVLAFCTPPPPLPPPRIRQQPKK